MLGKAFLSNHNNITLKTKVEKSLIINIKQQYIHKINCNYQLILVILQKVVKLLFLLKLVKELHFNQDLNYYFCQTVLKSCQNNSNSILADSGFELSQHRRNRPN